jgi:hypothetical protein
MAKEAASRTPILKTTDEKFGAQFIKDPAKALKTKGLVISEAESARLAREIEKLRARPGGILSGSPVAETEVTVSVGVKF